MGSPERYDYLTALQQLQTKIQSLEGTRQQYQQPRSFLRSAVSYWKANRAHIFAVTVLYSISTASMLAVFFADRALKVF